MTLSGFGVFWEGVDTAAYVQDILHHQANTSRRSRQPRQSNGITDDDSESEEDGSGSSQTGDEKYHSDSSDSFAGTDDDKTMSDRQVHGDGIVLIVSKPLKKLIL